MNLASFRFESIYYSDLINTIITLTEQFEQNQVIIPGITIVSRKYDESHQVTGATVTSTIMKYVC